MFDFDVIANYQFGFYGPGTGIEPSPEIIGELLTAFKGTGFMPNLVPTVHLLDQASSELKQMLTLVTNKSEWTIEFELHRFSFIKKHIGGDSEIGTAEEFIEKANEFCAKVLSIMPIKGNRFSYVMKGLLKEMSDEKLAKTNSKLMRLPDFYIEHPPQEWSTRNIARYSSENLGEPREIYNVITDINRVQKKIRNNIEVDRIEIGFDINTFHKNTKQRFDADDIKIFLSEAVVLSKKIMEEIDAKIL